MKENEKKTQKSFFVIDFLLSLQPYKEKLLFKINIFVNLNLKLMRYSLLKSVASLLLAIGASASATAQTTVYGIKSNWDGNSTVKFDIESLSTESKTTLESVQGINYHFENGIICGANVGDKYYAFLYDVNNNYSFATINHTTGEMTIINNKSYKLGKPGANMQAMAYNKATGK